MDMSSEPAKPKMIPYHGEQVPAVPMKIIYRAEGSNTYTLEDGSRLVITLTIHDVNRIEGKKNPLGDQVFQYSFEVTTRHHPKEQEQPS